MKKQDNRGSLREGLSLPDFHKTYGWMYDPLDVLLKQLASTGHTLLLGDRAELEAVNSEFADAVEAFRARLAKGIKPDHAKFMRSALYGVATDAYGENSEFAKVHGNRMEDAVILALGGPGKAAEFAKFVAEKAGIGEFEMSVQGISALVKKVQDWLSNASPSLPADASTRQRVEARVAFETSLGDVKKRMAWLRKWLAGQGVQPEGRTLQPAPGTLAAVRPTTTEPAGRGVDQVKAEIAEAQERIRNLNAEADQLAQGRNFKAAGERQTEAAKIEDVEVAKLRRELEVLEAAAAAIAREGVAAVIVRQAPPAPGDSPVLTGRPTVVVNSGDDDESGPLQTRIARLEEEIRRQNEAAEKHEASANRMFAEADEIRKTDRKAAALKDLEAEREKQAAEAALKAAEALAEKHSELVEQEKEPATVTEPVTVPLAEIVREVPEVGDLLAEPKARIAAQIVEAAAAGNTAMVEALKSALDALNK